MLRLNKHARVGMLTTITLSLLLSFQNCGEPLQSKNSLKLLSQSLPFAYDLELDHFAYMSCSNMPNGYSGKTFFTFRAGAYQTGGLKANSNYLSQTSRLSTADRIAGFSQSALNSAATPQLAIRSRYDYQEIFAANVNNFAQGYDYSNYLSSFDSSAVAEKLIYEQNTRHRTFPALGIDSGLEWNLRFTGTIEIERNLRSYISSGGMIAQTYTEPLGDAVTARGLALGSKDSVFGSGFIPTFEGGHGISPAGVINTYTIAAPRTVASVVELDLQTGSPKANWTCPDEYKFLIVRKTATTTDVGVRVACSAEGAEPVPTAAQRPAYEALRRLLPASDWGVDLNRRCIVQKNAGAGLCYGSDDSLAVNYNGGSCSADGTNCPHYVSICVRQ